MRRREALATLGLGPEADLATIKARFRALAHDHHPDRGGDAARFAIIRSAYRVLTEDPATVPRVARGTPSRRSTADRTAVLGSDADRVAAVVPLRQADVARMLEPQAPVLDGLALARLVLTALDSMDAARPGLTRHIRLLGTAPRMRLLGGPAGASLGSRTNVLDLVIPAAATSGLAFVAAQRSEQTAFHARLRTDARVVRRRLAALDLDPSSLGIAWHRQRGDRTTLLEARFPLRDAQSLPAVALRMGDAVCRLLDTLVWPLGCWSLAPDAVVLSILAPAKDVPPN